MSESLVLFVGLLAQKIGFTTVSISFMNMDGTGLTTLFVSGQDGAWNMRMQISGKVQRFSAWQRIIRENRYFSMVYAERWGNSALCLIPWGGESAEGLDCHSKMPLVFGLSL